MNHSDDDQNKEVRKYFIPVDGKYYETTKEVYEVYYRMDRRERYLEERDLKKGVVNFSDMGESYCSAEEMIISHHQAHLFAWMSLSISNWSPSIRTLGPLKKPRLVANVACMGI